MASSAHVITGTDSLHSTGRLSALQQRLAATTPSNEKVQALTRRLLAKDSLIVSLRQELNTAYDRLRTVQGMWGLLRYTHMQLFDSLVISLFIIKSYGNSATNQAIHRTICGDRCTSAGVPCTSGVPRFYTTCVFLFLLKLIYATCQYLQLPCCVRARQILSMLVLVMRVRQCRCQCQCQI